MKRLWYIASIRVPSERASSFAAMKLCEAFAHEGLDVTLVLPWRFGRIKRDPFDFYDTERSFAIRRLFALDLVPLDAVLGKLAFWARTITFRAVLMVARWRGKPEIVYTRDWALVHEGDILELHKFPARVTRWHRSAWEKAHSIVVVSDGLKEDLLAAGVPASKIIVAPNGIDAHEFKELPPQNEARSSLDIEWEGPVAVYTGSLQAWKGVDIIVSAARTTPEMLFVVVGGTDDGIREFQDSYGNPDNVLFIEHRPHHEIPRWLAVADALLLPTMPRGEEGERHTSPIKMFEYMAARRPIIASDLPSIREHLDETRAMMVPPGESDAIIGAIQTITNNKDKAHALVEQAAAYVQGYTWQHRAEKIVDAVNL